MNNGERGKRKKDDVKIRNYLRKLILFKITIAFLLQIYQKIVNLEKTLERFV